MTIRKSGPASRKLGGKVAQSASKAAKMDTRPASVKAGAKYGKRSGSRSAMSGPQYRLTPYFSKPKILGKPRVSIINAFALRENPFALNSFDVSVASLKPGRQRGLIPALDEYLMFRARTRTNENGHIHELILWIEPHDDGSVTKHSKICYTCSDKSHIYWGMEWHNSRQNYCLSPLYYSNGQPPTIRRPGRNRPTLCIAKGAMIATSRGLLPIESVTVGMAVATPNGYRKVLAASKTGVRKTIRLHYANRAREKDDGPSLTLTPDHQVLVHNETTAIAWKEAQCVVDGDYLVQVHQPNNQQLLKLPKLGREYAELCIKADHSQHNVITPARMPTHLTPALAEIVGFWVSEGYANCIAQTLGSRTRKRIFDIVNETFDLRSNHPHGTSAIFLGTKVGSALEAWGLINRATRSHDKYTSDLILRSNDAVVAAYLGGLISGDGWTNGTNNITFASKSPTLVKDFVLLANRLGLPFYVTEGYSGHANTRMLYARLTTPTLVQKALKLLPIHKTYDTTCRVVKKSKCNYATGDIKLDVAGMLRKDPVFLAWLASVRPHAATKCGIGRAVLSVFPVLKNGNSRGEGQRKHLKTWFRASELATLADSLPACQTKDAMLEYRLLDKDAFYMVRYSRTSEGPTTDVYDLTVHKDKCFVANGVLVHNCKHATAVLRYIISKKLVPIQDTRAATAKRNDPDKLHHPIDRSKRNNRR